jgi:hypothetical protein
MRRILCAVFPQPHGVRQRQGDEVHMADETQRTPGA